MKYILSHNGPDDTKQSRSAIEALLQDHQVHVVDGSMLPDMAKVEVTSEQVPALQSGLGKEWSLYPEKTYSIPTTKKSIRNSST